MSRVILFTVSVLALTGCAAKSYDENTTYSDHTADKEVSGSKSVTFENNLEESKPPEKVDGSMRPAHTKPDTTPFLPDTEPKTLKPAVTQKLKRRNEPEVAKSEKVIEPNRPSVSSRELASTSQPRRPSEAQGKLIPDTHSPNFTAPLQYGHPLNNSKKLVFMLGEDEKGLYLYGEGAITKGAYKKFLNYLNFYKKQKKEISRLMLHSPGGFLHEGLKIGEYIRNNGWTTDSDKHMKCYSTCAFIYAAGLQKRFQNGAEVGFHRPYLPEQPHTETSIRQVYRDYLPYWQFIEGDLTLYDDFMSNYGRDEMLILDGSSVSSLMEVELY